MNKAIHFVLISLAMASTALAQEAYDREAELAALTAKCEYCHGPGGAAPRTGVPVLAGRDAEEIAEILLQFRHYERFCRKHVEYAPGGEVPVDLTMCDVAGSLTPDEISEMSSYFSRQSAAGGESGS